jgi:LmbE family N-acetylglucosaminyl deacetylase
MRSDVRSLRLLLPLIDMRRALVLALIGLSLLQMDRRRAKSFLRYLAVIFCRWALGGVSRAYILQSGNTVVFAPHQDDETMGCGGLIARKRNEGLPVHVIFITDGSASHPNHPRLAPPAIAAMRRQEAREALAILGVESVAIQFLDEPDGTLDQLTPTQREKLIAHIAALLGELKPEEIFLPCNPDGSSEHDAAFGFVLEAVQRARLRPTIWQYPIWSWWNPALLLRRMFSFGDRILVPTEDYALIKSRALACYRSQIQPLAPQVDPVLPPELVRIFNSKAEYFFRFPLSAVASSPRNERPPVV